jgi:hypothetical protein
LLRGKAEDKTGGLCPPVRGVFAKTGGLYLCNAQGKPAVFANTPLTGGRSPPVLSSAFPRSNHINSVFILLGADPKTGFPLRSIFLFIFFFLSNIFMLTAGKVITNFVQKPSNQIFFGMTGFLWEIGKPD